MGGTLNLGGKFIAELDFPSGVPCLQDFGCGIREVPTDIKFKIYQSSSFIELRAFGYGEHNAPKAYGNGCLVVWSENIPEAILTELKKAGAEFYTEHQCLSCSGTGKQRINT